MYLGSEYRKHSLLGRRFDRREYSSLVRVRVRVRGGQLSLNIDHRP
jgi:hypothetical protein